MTTDADSARAIEVVVRSLVTAVKTLRLYPATSPIPLQSIQAATDALDDVLARQPVLPLVVTRNGFSHQGVAVSAPGASELADLLTAHGVAELDFLPGCSREEVSTLLEAVLSEPDEVRAKGGMAVVLAGSGTGSITISEVVLTTVTSDTLEGEDIDEFLRELASDPDKLAAWLAAATKGDIATLSDGLGELARAVGPDGAQLLADALGKAFMKQDSNGRDALVGLALGQGEVTGLLGRMLGTLGSGDIASSLAGGMYAQNMLSMSNVLTALPFGERLDAILEEIRPMLTDEGHSEREIVFLNHMLEVRSSPDAEPALADAHPDYRTVAAISRVKDEEIDRARDEIRASAGTVSVRTVNTMLSLLDQQTDYDLWSKTLSGLASVVPTLFVQHEFALADRVLADLSTRESRTTQPWPGLAERIAEATEQATSAEAMSALLHAVADDPATSELARSVLRRVGIGAQQRLVLDALGMREVDGLAIAEELLGRRIVDLLVALAPGAQWYHVGAIARRLAGEPDARSLATLDGLLARPDEQSRQEAAKGLGLSEDAAAVGVLARLARDPAAEVAVTAVRALGRSKAPGAARTLASLAEDLDIDGKDFALGRELIGALARTTDRDADEALARLAGRRTLIKRGHFGEVQDLVSRAIKARAQGGVAS